MRVKNSLKNIGMSIFTQVVAVLLGFISRKIFIDNLGSEYLGINGLLTNILSMLSLVEGGIGASITYNLYKPLAEKDEEKIIALVQLYKKLYSIIAMIVVLLSLFLYPFIDLLIKGGTTVPYIGIVYSIFIAKNIISYLNAHKWSLINADQKSYVLGKYNLLFNVITTILKIIVLKTTQNYILFLLIEVVVFIIQNIYVGSVISKKYKYIRTSIKYKVDNNTKENLITNVKAIFLHNIGKYCVFGTDNLLISSMINIKTVGLYSNYNMIIGQLSSLVDPILNGVGASVGNLIAKDTNEKCYEVFKLMYLINFWIYSISVILLYNLLQPFITWWLGSEYLIDKLTLIILLFNFYVTGLRTTVNIFKSKAGIFSEDKYIPLIEATLNLGSSIILARYIGLAGIFMGTIISTICIPVWTQSKLVYNNIFNKSVIEYFKKYIFYILLTMVVGLLTSTICSNLIVDISFISLVKKGIICLIVPNIIYILIFYKTNEFNYIYNILIQKKYNLKIKAKVLR